MTEIKSSKPVSKKRSWTRRAFMIAGGVAGAGLVVGAAGVFHISRKIKQFSGTALGEGASLNAWVRIAPDNTITLAIPRAEMGQGVYTSLPLLVAEELEVELDAVQVIHPQPEAPYTNIFMLTQIEPNLFEDISLLEKVVSFITVVGTGGSSSVPDGYTNLRYAGATAREMLKQAAAARWDIQASACHAENGYIIHPDGNQKLTYGELATEAADIELAALPALRAKKDWKKLGKPAPRTDVPAKSTGTATFGVDVRPEGLLYAAFRHPKVYGGKIVSAMNADEIIQRRGVKKVVLTDSGVAVIADNTWRAKEAMLNLRVVEEDGPHAAISSENIEADLQRLIKEDAVTIAEEEGDVDPVFSGSGDDSSGIQVSAAYALPYLAHATMEPLNCTVLVEDNAAQVWVGHQAASIARSTVANLTGIDAENVIIHVTYLGGGFGRRAEIDFVRKATEVALQMKGIPVMTVFTREEDMKNDYYRPAALSNFKAVIQPDGTIRAWENRIAQQSLSYQTIKRTVPAMPASQKNDMTATEGAIHLPYHMDNRRVVFNYLDSPLPVGFWRSVGNSQHGFFTECFMDECAHAAGMDPYTFRRSKLENQPRFAAVLDRLAEVSNWQQSLPADTFHGLSLHKSFGSIVGQVAEISRHDEKTFSIDRYYCVVDCGTYISPDIIESQMQGGIIFGLSAALYGEITWQNGQVQQANFPQYRMVQMAIAPEIDVHIMENDEYPGGIGEPGTPPAASALANALFAATGERVRILPLSKLGYNFV